MANNRYVLDTSAIFALIENEDGADRLAIVLSLRELYVSKLNGGVIRR